MQGLADIDIAKAGDQSLIEKRRLERGLSSANKRRQHFGVEGIGKRFDAKPREKGLRRKLRLRATESSSRSGADRCRSRLRHRDERRHDHATGFSSAAKQKRPDGSPALLRCETSRSCRDGRSSAGAVVERAIRYLARRSSPIECGGRAGFLAKSFGKGKREDRPPQFDAHDARADQVGASPRRTVSTSGSSGISFLHFTPLDAIDSHAASGRAMVRPFREWTRCRTRMPSETSAVIRTPSGPDPFRLFGSSARRKAGTGRRRFSQGRASLRRDERSDVGRPASRLERRAGRQSAVRSRLAPFKHLDVAGGTGDIAFRVARAGGPQTDVTVLDINADMLAVGRERAEKKGFDDAIDLRRGQCRGTAFPDAEFDAYTIAFGIRNVPRIDKALGRGLSACSSAAAASFASNFPRSMRRCSARIYESYSFSVIPLHRPAGHRRSRALSLSGGIDPPIPAAEEFAAMIEAAGFQRVGFTRLTGGVVAIHSGWKFKRSGVLRVGNIGHVLRLGRAGFILAREGVFSGVDAADLAAPRRGWLWHGTR